MKDRKLKTRPKNHTTHRIFVAGTRMNDGKTTTCLGLFAALQQKYSKVGFIKPVGQRFVKIDGQLIDEDSILLEKTYNVETPISSMSPIAIDGSFTKRVDHIASESLGPLPRMHRGAVRSVVSVRTAS